MIRFNQTKLFISITTLLLSLSAPVFADGGVAMPTKKGGWNVGIDALYLRANTDNLTYAILVNNPFLTSFDHNNEVLEPTYDWGARIQAGYWFPCTCYDVNLSYVRLNTIDSDSVLANPPNSAILVPPLSDNPLADNFFNGANSKIEFTLNVVDLDAGRHVSCNDYDVRFFAGLRYATIDSNLYTTANDPFSGSIDANQQFRSHFKGIGPRIGTQARYGHCCGWGLDADLSMALLVGQLDSHYHARDVTDNTRWNAQEVKNCAIPAFEAKLGVDYTYRMGCRRDASLVFEAGYQGSSYFDAINTPSLNNGYDGLYTSAASTTSNISFNGPYLGVKYYA